MGFSIVIFAIEPLFAAVKGLAALTEGLASGTTAESLRASMASRTQVEDVLGAPLYKELEEEYLPSLAPPPAGAAERGRRKGSRRIGGKP